MRLSQNANGRQTASRSSKPGWLLVAQKELTDLWFGGRALIILIFFSLLLGLMSFLLASNSELKLLPPQEMLFIIIQITIGVGLFISILISADSISGERERATLEGLLLVPTSRRQIILGKFVAAISPWPAAFALATVHMAVLSPNRAIFMAGLTLGGLLGTLIVLGFTSFGMLLSLWANSNRSSLFISLFVSVLFLLPTQFPGTAQTGYMGRLVKRINPMESVNQILEKMLVNNRTFDEMASWLAAPVIFTIICFGILFLYSAPRLAFDADKSRLPRPKWTRSITILLVIVSLTFMHVPPTMAQTVPGTYLQISIDTEYSEAKTGDTLEFTTVVTYNGTEQSSPIIVAMNIVNLGIGDPVDPEDWSPERTQEVEPLNPGESAEQSWTINAILEGDYLVYMVVIPEPEGPQATSLPTSSMGIHLTVSQFSPLNPLGVAPVAFGMPIGLTAVLGFQLWLRRRRTGSSTPVRD